MRVFHATESGEPGEDILDHNIVINVKRGVGRIKNIPLIDFDTIKIPKEGVFIGFEFLIVTKNEVIPRFITLEPEYKRIRNYPGNNKSKAEYKAYMPMIGAFETTEDDNAWTFHGGKWNKNFSEGVDLTFTSKYRTIAMEVVVSN